MGALAGTFAPLFPYPDPGLEFAISLETDDRDILHVWVEFELEFESFLEEDNCESWDGFRVTVHEFLLRWS